MDYKVANYEVISEVTTSGNTSTPTVVSLTLLEKTVGGKTRVVSFPVLRVKVTNAGGYANATNATIAATSGTGTIQTVSANKELVISGVTAAQATGTLTISGVVAHGQTVTVGSRVYEFVAGAAAQTGRVAANIAASMTAAQGTLTVDTQPTAGDTMTIGSRTYVFVANGTADNPGEISVGTNLATAQTNIRAAINGTDNVNTANASVTCAAFSANAAVLTAIIEGTVGNSIVTTETFAAGTNVFDAATLGTTTAGTNCSAANAVTALVAAINGDASATVTAADGAGDTVVVTAKTAGSAANSTATTETMANGVWGSATLTGGVNASNATSVTLTDATAETFNLLVTSAQYGYPIKPYRLAVTHAAP